MRGEPTSSPSTPAPSVLGWGVGVVVDPARTLRSIVAARPIGAAVLVVAVMGGVDGGISCIPLATGEPSSLYTGVSLAAIAGGAAFGLLIFVLSLAVLALLYHLAARLLGQNGSFAGVCAGIGFASVPLVFLAPLSLASATGGVVGSSIGALGALGVVLWQVVLQALAIRENYRTSTRVAIAILAIGVVAALVAFLFSLLAVALLFLLVVTLVLG